MEAALTDSPSLYYRSLPAPLGWAPSVAAGRAQAQIQDKGWACPAKVSAGVITLERVARAIIHTDDFFRDGQLLARPQGAGSVTLGKLFASGGPDAPGEMSSTCQPAAVRLRALATPAQETSQPAKQGRAGAAGHGRHPGGLSLGFPQRFV